MMFAKILGYSMLTAVVVVLLMAARNWLKYRELDKKYGESNDE